MGFRPQIAIVTVIGLWNVAAFAADDVAADNVTGDELVQAIWRHGIGGQSGRAHVAALADDSCYIAGQGWTKEAGVGLWLWRIDLAGEKLWSQQIATQEKTKVEQAAVGILPGRRADGRGEPSGVRVVVRELANAKILIVDSSGNIEPQPISIKCIGAHGAIALTDGDIVLFGSDHARPQSQSWIMRVSHAGVLRWQKNFDASAAKWSDDITAARLRPPPPGLHRADYLYAAALLRDGSLAFTGKTGEHNKFGQGPTKLWLLKINDRGERLAETFIDDGTIFPGTRDLIAAADDDALVTYSVDQLPPIGGAPYTFPPDGFRARLLRVNAKLEKEWETLLPATSMPGAAAITGQAPYISKTVGDHELIVRGTGAAGEELWASHVSAPDFFVLPLSTLRIGHDVLAVCNYTSRRKEDRERMNGVLLVRVRPPQQ